MHSECTHSTTRVWKGFVERSPTGSAISRAQSAAGIKRSVCTRTYLKARILALNLLQRHKNDSPITSSPHGNVRNTRTAQLFCLLQTVVLAAFLYLGSCRSNRLPLSYLRALIKAASPNSQCVGDLTTSCADTSRVCLRRFHFILGQVVLQNSLAPEGASSTAASTPLTCDTQGKLAWLWRVYRQDCSSV